MSTLLVAGNAFAAKPQTKSKIFGPGPSLAAFQHRITTGNRIEFNMANSGYLAIDPNRGSATPGGFWPSGSEDAYIYQMGLHVMGIIDADGDGIASDVVETNLVFDSEWREGRATETADNEKSRLYFSTSDADLAEWPEEFMAVDKNQNSATFGQLVPDVRSEQDIVSIYTDIDAPINSAAGNFRLGVEVRQHVMLYSLSDIQDIMFVIWDVYNVSHLVNDPGVRTDGYDIHDAYVNIKNDFDIGANALDDRAAVSPIRNMSIAFDADFSENGFSGVPAFLGTSFLEGPTDSDGIDNPNPLFPSGNGLVDETFGDIEDAGLRDPRTDLFYDFPADVQNESAERMTLFTINTNGGERPDPNDDAEAYRILSGDPNEVRVPTWDPYADLIIADQVGDLRQNIVSGPFEMFIDLEGNHPHRVVAAFYFARPENSDVNINDLTITGEFKPIIDLWKAARDVHANMFTVPSPPPPPGMRIIPGDRQVTLTWDDLPVDAVDPYASTEAAQSREPVNGFPDLRYRAQDFEGFRVYRSLTGSADDARLIAQYDLDNEYKTYTITRAVATDQGLEDVVETIPLGENTGLSFSYTDRGDDIDGLINGVPLFYTVTSYDFNPVLIGNESLESSINFRRQDANGKFYQLAIPRTSSTSIVSGSGNWVQVDAFDVSVEASVLPSKYETIAYIDSANLTTRSQVIEYADAITPTTKAFLGDMSDIVVIDAENIPEIGGYLVVDSILHTNKDTRNHIHYLHFEDQYGTSTTSGTFTIPYNEIEGLYPADEVNQQEKPFSFSGPLLADGPSFNGTAYFRKGGLNYGKIAPLRVKLADGSQLEYTNLDCGSYETLGHLTFPDFKVQQPFIAHQMNGLISRTTGVAGQFAPGSIVISWSDENTIEVWDAANNVPVRFNEQVADGWGFLPLDVFDYDTIAEDQVENQREFRQTYLVGQATYVTDPNQAGAEMMALYVRGVELLVTGITTRPQAGDEWTLDMGFIGNSSFTSPFAGMRLKLQLTQASTNTSAGRLDQVKVVPNPYVASSLYDSGPNKRAIMFTHLPLRATIRIYTISGNLVNILKHGPGKEGSIGGTSDGNSGQFSYDLTNRFGNLLASGIYYFHVTDDNTGDEYLGKFSIIQ